MISPLVKALNELELASAELLAVRAERDVALEKVTVLTKRIVDLEFALEREIHRTRTCTEAGIMAGIKEGIKAGQNAREPKRGKK